jgi:hypothetical protein
MVDLSKDINKLKNKNLEEIWMRKVDRNKIKNKKM